MVWAVSGEYELALSAVSLYLRRCTLVLVVLVLSMAPALAEVPTQINRATQRGVEVLWVSAEAATTEAGLRDDVLSQHQREVLSHTLAAAREARLAAETRSMEHQASGGQPGAAKTSECFSWILSAAPPVVEELTFGNLLARARLAVVGNVVDERQGFFGGEAVTLFEVAVDSVLYSERPKAEIPSIFVTYPNAVIRVGSEMVCQRGRRYPERPMVGKRLAVFGYKIVSWDPVVVSTDDDELLFERRDGSVSFPARFGDLLDALEWRSLEAELEALERPPWPVEP